MIIFCAILIAYPLFSLVSTLSQINDHLAKILEYLHELTNKQFFAESMDVSADAPELQSSFEKLLWVMKFDKEQYEKERAEKAKSLVMRALKEGNKVKAIVEYKRAMKVGLVEAHDFVESQANEIDELTG